MSKHISPGVNVGQKSRKNYPDDARGRSWRTFSQRIRAIGKPFRLAAVPHLQIRRRRAADEVFESAANGTGQRSPGVEFSQREGDRLPSRTKRRESFRSRFQIDLWFIARLLPLGFQS